MLRGEDLHVFEEFKCKRRMGRSRKENIRGCVGRQDRMKTKLDRPDRVKCIKGSVDI